MSLKQKIQTLVYASDLERVGMTLAQKESKIKFKQFKLKLQKEFKEFKLTEHNLKKYTPDLISRINFVSMEICILVFKYHNPEKTIEDFRRNFLGTIPGHKVYKEILEKVSEILVENILLKDLQNFQTIVLESSDNGIEEL